MTTKTKHPSPSPYEGYSDQENFAFPWEINKNFISNNMPKRNKEKHTHTHTQKQYYLKYAMNFGVESGAK